MARNRLDRAIELIRALSEHVPPSVTDGSAPGWAVQYHKGRQGGLQDALLILDSVMKDTPENSVDQR
jgi:hypothetical protein